MNECTGAPMWLKLVGSFIFVGLGLAAEALVASSSANTVVRQSATHSLFTVSSPPGVHGRRSAVGVVVSESVPAVDQSPSFVGVWWRRLYPPGWVR